MPEAPSEQRTPKPEMFRLTNAETDIVENTDTVAEYTVSYLYTFLWKWQVPASQEILLQPDHHFGCYLYARTDSEFDDEQHVRVEVWDADLRVMRIIWEGRYVECKEMQDLDKMATLDLIDLDKPVNLKSGDFIWVSVMSDYVNPSNLQQDSILDCDVCYFWMEMLRIRPSMFK